MAAKAENILDDLIGRVARVRWWLVALGALKTASVGLACVCLYVGLYAWIDHQAHFGHAARLLALLVLLILLAALAHFLVQALRRSMTYAYAANYVENRRSFNQQLVAAVEYFEKRQDYPYSRALAEQLVLQVNEAARGFRFDSTIDKWKGYVLAGLIILGLSIVGLFVQQNVLYFSSYLSRLLRPLAQIEPVPATVLAAVTEDLVVACDTPVELAVAVQGRTPETASLVLTPRDPNDANVASESVEVRPTVDSQGNTTLTTSRTFGTPGRFSYRFEAEGASSAVHTVTVCEPPSIKSMTATISSPQGKGAAPVTYTQEVKDGLLEVLPNSTVELQVECTTPLREASVTMPGGQPAVQTTAGAGTPSIRLSPTGGSVKAEGLGDGGRANHRQAALDAATRSVKEPDAQDGPNTLNLQFSADSACSMDFKLTSADGVANSEPQQLHIQLKTDAPPEFKLLCPEGDCLATDVASIPITFEVTDDFGLDAVQLYCELPGRSPTVIDSKTSQGAKSATLSHTLELEEYDLRIGDSVLFYARAVDVDTGQRTADVNSCSEVYFIEVRPYRQYWHPEEGGRPSSNPGPVPEDLITILEYTRAILKKTWTLANASLPATENVSRFDTLRGDVEHCARQLAKARDDPENEFSELDKAALRRIEERYNEAGDKLKRYDADAALPPVRDAYRLLRQFIDELHLKWTPPQQGQSVPEEKPERIKLQEEPQSSEMDPQRIENRLEKLQRKIESLAREQKSLSSDLNKAVQQEQAASSGRPDGSSSSSPSSRGQSSQSASQASQPQPTRDTQGADRKTPQQTQDRSRAAGRDSDASRDPGASEVGKANNQADSAESGTAEGTHDSTQTKPQAASQASAQQSSPQGSSGVPQNDKAGEARSASTAGEDKGAGMDARMRMLEARQKAIREQASQVQTELGQLPTVEVTAQGRARDEAQKHVAQAVEEMKECEEKLADARYEATVSQDKAGLSESADSARRQLAEAGRAIRQGLAGDEPRTAAEQAGEMAEQLAEDAEALDESLSPADRQRMLERLEAAKRLLKSNPDPQWASMTRGGAASGALVYTQGGSMTPAETARMLARELWSIAIEARQKELQPFAESPSDAEFFQAEKEFFEKAARFKPPSAKK